MWFLLVGAVGIRRFRQFWGYHLLHPGGERAIRTAHPTIKTPIHKNFLTQLLPLGYFCIPPHTPSPSGWHFSQKRKQVWQSCGAAMPGVKRVPLLQDEPLAASVVVSETSYNSHLVTLLLIEL